MTLLTLLACLAPRNPLPDGALLDDVDPTPPEVASAELLCDPTTQQWALALSTSGWAGRVWSWWSADGDYIEDRALPSVAHAPDGTGEDFFLTLNLSPDFRDVDPRFSTALSCGDEPAVRVVVSDLDDVPYDCVDFAGALESWEGIQGVPGCPIE